MISIYLVSYIYITFFFYLAKKCICTVDKRFVIPIVDVDSVSAVDCKTRQAMRQQKEKFHIRLFYLKEHKSDIYVSL